MSFINPEFLIWMLPPLGVMMYFLLRRKVSFSSAFENRVLERLIIAGDALGSKGRQIIMGGAFVLMIVALARPVSHPKEMVLSDGSGQVMVLLDISRSMNVQDVYPDRLTFAKNRLSWWMEQMKGTEIGIMAFAKDAFLVAPLSLDTASLQFLLQGVQSDMVSRQGTDIANALRQSQKLFHENDLKELFIISDGGEEKDIEAAIDVAKELALRVHVMVVGTEKGGPIPEASGLVKDGVGNIVISKRHEGLKRLSAATGGIYIQEFGQGDGVRLLQQALESQKKEGKTRRVISYTEWFYFPLALAVALVLFSLSGIPKRRISLVLCVLLGSMTGRLEAGLLDFWYLQEATEAVSKKAYQEAGEAFAKVTEKAEAKYNEGNMYYRQGAYDKALQAYGKVQTDDKTLKFQTLHNMGNALAQAQKIPEAIKQYEAALKLKEDEATRFNLELLKKRQEQQNKDKKQQQNNKDSNKESSKDSQQEQSSQEKNKKQEAKADTKEAKNEAKENDENPSKKESDAKEKPEKRAMMSEEEAKKWEKKLLEGHPKTHPMPLGDQRAKGDENAITW